MNAVRGWMSILLLGLSPLMASLAPKGVEPSEKPTAPQFVAWVNYLADGLFLHAVGEPGSEALLAIRLVEWSPTEAQGLNQSVNIPIRFDITGTWAEILPLSELATEAPTAFEFKIVSIPGYPAEEISSTEWRLETGCISAATPGLENPPLGGLEFLSMPGSHGPPHPVTWAVLAAPGLLLEGAPHNFAFSLAPTGIEGVLPVN